MKILDWVHRKLSPKHAVLHRPNEYSPGGHELSGGQPCEDTLTLQFSNWHHGLFAIGTFGLDAEEALAHALKGVQANEHLPLQKDELVNVTVGLVSGIHCTKPNATVDDRDAACEFYDREKKKSNAEFKVGIKIRALEEFFKESSPAGASVRNTKKKSTAAQTLGSCLFGNGTGDELMDVKRCNRDRKLSYYFGGYMFGSIMEHWILRHMNR